MEYALCVMKNKHPMANKDATIKAHMVEVNTVTILYMGVKGMGLRLANDMPV